jgi:UDPglucose--hexose-1-phosphate uridylyltransferase
LCAVVEKERENPVRMVAENGSFAAYIPFFARYPYETHITTLRHLQTIDEMSGRELQDLAEILKQVLSAFDALFDKSFPYIMVVHQGPSDGLDHSYYHFHIEFYPPMRSAVKLKYLAGSEAGAGMFINDTLPETKAPELRALIKPVEWTSGSAE